MVRLLALMVRLCCPLSRTGDVYNNMLSVLKGPDRVALGNVVLPPSMVYDDCVLMARP
jgi:hypothetical protein